MHLKYEALSFRGTSEHEEGTDMNLVEVRLQNSISCELRQPASKCCFSFFRAAGSSVRDDVLTIVCVQHVVLWVVTPCSTVGGYHSFGGTYCFHLYGRR
jgi:hypothetical protein